MKHHCERNRRCGHSELERGEGRNGRKAWLPGRQTFVVNLSLGDAFLLSVKGVHRAQDTILAQSRMDAAVARSR